MAIQSTEDQLIYRTQLRYRRFDIDSSNADVEAWVQSNVLMYGWTSRLSTVAAAPLIYRDFDSPTTNDEDFGVGDVKFLLRYRLWKELGYLKSKSWTVLGGVEIHSDDEPFSSRSWDPIVGTVYSWREGRQGFDADLVYQINTQNDRDFEAGDVLRYDLACQYRLWPEKYSSETKWSLTGLLEVNGEHHGESEFNGRSVDETDGHQIFLSPGLVLAGKRVKLEAGLQIPTLQTVGDSAAKDDLRMVLGFTMSF